MAKKAERRADDLRVSAKRKKIQAKVNPKQAEKHNFFKAAPVGEIALKKDETWVKGKKLKAENQKKIEVDE
jgi:hypothetical protein